ncbi:MAG: ribosome silencing factor [Chloroflexi bacterium]|nr:ribosome silencing factor [Chloroflexota bacterium]MCL5075245.1 ribosome silencing factor [Chloroflexota bacterium]
MLELCRGGFCVLESVELAHKVVEIVSDKKASDIILLDLRGVSLIADYFVICSGQSERQIQAVADDILKSLESVGVKPLQTEGTSHSGWVLVDYGDVIVHIFAPSEREYYRLERLWSKATTVLRMQ